MRRLSVEKKKERNALVYLIPGTVFMLAFVVIPVAMSVVMSFFYIPSLGATWEFTGFSNYLLAFQSQRWLHAIGRTLLFGGWGIITGLIMGLLLSFLVAKNRFLNAYRYIFYLPAIVSALTMGRLWNYMLSPGTSGFFNSLLMMLGKSEPVNWLGNTQLVPFVVMATSLYGAGGGMTLVLFTTAINNVDHALIESAKLEGATRVQIAMRIELPMIRPIITASLILSVIGAFKNFEGLYALIPNSREIETIAVLLYKESLSSSYGYGTASAMGTMLTLLVMIIMIVYIKWPSAKEAD